MASPSRASRAPSPTGALFSLDDVGQGYDIAQGDPERVAVTLGRHTNDLMTSFYANSPSGFMMEYGWADARSTRRPGSRSNTTTDRACGGHDRAWLTPEGRQRARELRLDGAATGHRAPVQVMNGNTR